VFGGNAEAAAQAQEELLVHTAIAAAGILLLLIVVTKNWRNLLLVLANVPFAHGGRGAGDLGDHQVSALRAPMR
jgi:Cu/Ag efflux pump CusA